MADTTIWREGATAEEAAAVDALDCDIANLRALLAAYSTQRQLIANRACQRARYWRGKKSTAGENTC